MNDRLAHWLLLLVRVPAEPTRHRVAVWRELRRSGAVLLGQAVWAVEQQLNHCTERLADYPERVSAALNQM